ncbi:hypothetical protein Cni_G09087 [Canna indica]|uniref:Replication factor C subunit n=1 Tax=Canna indica TaxID=4628 RepID=A0AAQ3Q7E4_9LILI|nr:hypothetical protein Cni_G09087 [Canna indica]
MPVMEKDSRQNRSHDQPSFGRKKSGYEPSDTESEWQESPWHDGQLTSRRPITPLNHARTINSFNNIQTQFLNEDNSQEPVHVSRTSSTSRRHSKSPYKLVRNVHDGNFPSGGSSLRKNTSPLKASDHYRQVSPYRFKYEETNNQNNDNHNSVLKMSNKTPPRSHKFSDGNTHSQFQEVSRASSRSIHSRSRSISAPKPRGIGKELHVSTGPIAAGQSCSPQIKSIIQDQIDHANAREPSIVMVNDMIGNKKLAKSPSYNAYDLKSVDSISPGDIFFSKDHMILTQKSSATDMGNNAQHLTPKMHVISENSFADHQLSKGTSFSSRTSRGISVRRVLSRTSTNSSSAISQLSTGRTSTNSMSASTHPSRGGISNDSSKFSDDSGKSAGGFIKFANNRQKNKTDAWFSCVKVVSCGKSKPPEYKAIDEASLIEKAFVVEELRLFWADKNCPRSLDGFICHRQEAKQLKQLVSYNRCPHILFKGPTGSGKKSLCMALLHELFGDSSSKVSHDLKYYNVQESSPMPIVFPVTSSSYHVELNLKSLAKNARHALMAVIKEIATNHAYVPEVSDASFKMDFKVIVLYEVDKVTENVQHLIKWIMDCYSHACKIVICCDDDLNIIDSIKNRCKIISVDPPVTHEIIEVLNQIATKESFELPANFAVRIASKCKQNLRRAIMALEACKAHNYPFIDEQPIAIGWEEVLIEIAREILDDPSPKRLVLARGKIQKLLVEFVHPNLILQKLVEEFLKGIEGRLKRELYYWHAYYNKRLPVGTSAVMKLEEFVAKIMSIHRKSLSAFKV